MAASVITEDNYLKESAKYFKTEGDKLNQMLVDLAKAMGDANSNGAFKSGDVSEAWKTYKTYMSTLENKMNTAGITLENVINSFQSAVESKDNYSF